MLNVQQQTLHEKRQWELRRRNLRANQLPQHQVLGGVECWVKYCCWMKGHQLQQAAGRRTRRPRVGMLNVQHKTLLEERQWKLRRRNLRARQLPQHQVLGGG